MSGIILGHAFFMITGNFRQLLKIALFPMLLFLPFTGAAMYVNFLNFNPPDFDVYGGSPNLGMQYSDMGAMALLSIGLQLIGIFFAAMAAVAWHRFVLLEQEPQGWFSAFTLKRVFPYVGYSILIGIIVGLCRLLNTAPLALSLWLKPTSEASLGIQGFLMVYANFGRIILLPFLIILGSRLSVMLPAAAINKSMTLKQAWTTTKGSSLTVLLIWPLPYILMHYVGFMALVLRYSPFMILGALGFALLALVVPILIISIMTTLYDHYVEERELA